MFTVRLQPRVVFFVSPDVTAELDTLMTLATTTGEKMSILIVRPCYSASDERDIEIIKILSAHYDICLCTDDHGTPVNL